MCGITAYWARESVPGRGTFEILLEGASLRGSNGIGLGIVSNDNGIYCKFVQPFSECKDQVLNFIESHMGVGCILLVNCRATPETENATTEEMLQPIINNGKWLVHNGGVTDSIKKGVSYEYTTDIDSEAIIGYYEEYHNNMKIAMEHIVGSFAFVMYDSLKRKLYAVTSFNPLAHMYIRGYGYFLHSDNDVLSQVLEKLTGQTQDGVNVWESWYHHYLEGYTILETDIDSGFQFKQKYTPRFLHPVWNSLQDKGKTKTLVVASGGIDSGLTAHVLKLAGHDVELLHFLYGQKSQDAEKWAVDHIAQFLHIPARFIDLSFLYSSNEKGMLTDENIDINTGGELIKSTIAWQSGRNMLFASIAMVIAEQMITSGKCDHVNISAGWAQISEETGGFPDNSFQFNQSLEQLKMYGCIVGSRIEFLPVMQRLTKTEEWILGDAIAFPFEYTVSCDSPTMFEGRPILCVSCGSTKLSILASDRAGVKDPRQFNCVRPILSTPMKNSSIQDIVKRLVLTPDEKKSLLNYLKN